MNIKALCAAFSTCSDMEMKEAVFAREVVAAHIKGCVLNFLTAQENDGYIPIMLSGNGLFAGYFHGEHAKGIPLNQHKPFLCQAALQAGELIVINLQRICIITKCDSLTCVAAYLFGKTIL